MNDTQPDTEIICERCQQPGDFYELPDGTGVVLCNDHAKGYFCLSCKSFIGGTENIFIYGAWECEFCQGWQEDVFGGERDFIPKDDPDYVNEYDTGDAPY